MNKTKTQHKQGKRVIKMRKILTLSMVVLLHIFVFCPFALAAVDDVFTLTAVDVAARPNETGVIVQINLERVLTGGDDQIAGLQFDIGYDNTKIEAMRAVEVNVADGGLVPEDWWFYSVLDHANGRVSIGIIAATSHLPTGNGELARITFDVIGAGADSESTLTFTGAIINDDFDVIEIQNVNNGTFIIDGTDPDVAIDAPTSGIYSNTSITVSGTVIESNIKTATLTLTGLTPINIKDDISLIDGTFGVLVNGLGDSSYDITLECVDLSGNTGAGTVSIIIDTLAPIVSIDSPGMDDVINSDSVLIEGTVNDNGGSGVAWVQIDGISADLFDGISFSHGINGLADGAHSFIVTAQDNAGIPAADQQIDITVDTIAPVIDVTDPADDITINVTTYAVSGSVTETGSGIDRVRVNGNNATLVGNSFSYDLTGLSEGDNTVTVTSQDIAGNPATPVQRSITVDTTPISLDEDPVVLSISEDTFIAENVPSTIFGSDVSIYADGQYPDTSTDDAYALLRWSLLGIPSGTPVTYATITFNMSSLSSSAYDLYEMRRSWVENEATWRYASFMDDWEIDGAKGSSDRGSTELGEIYFHPSTYDVGLRSISLYSDGLDVVRSWIDDASTNHGVLISGTSSDDLTFDSKESTGGLASAPTLKIFTKLYPYLQDVTQNSIKVMWETDIPSIGTVEYGLDESYGSTATELNLQTIHEVTITGLEENTDYYYRVASDGILSADAIFRTAPDPSSGFTFLVYSDTQGYANTNSNYNSAHEALVNSMLVENDPNTILIHAGDVTHDASVDEWLPQFFLPARNILKGNVLYTAYGNHDLITAGEYENYFEPPDHNGSGTELYYSFNYGNTHFIFLDTNQDIYGEAVPSEQYNWLFSDLDSPEATDAEWIIVVGHHPIYSGSLDGFMPNPQRNRLTGLFKAKGVDMYICGHAHIYERSYEGGIYYLIAGPASPITNEADQMDNPYSEFSRGGGRYYCQIKASETSMVINAYDEGGDNFDTFTITNTPAESLNVEQMRGYDLIGNGSDELIVDFGPAKGIWAAGYSAEWVPVADPDNNNPHYPWGHLHGMSAERIVSTDLDGNGVNELIGDFGPTKGIWAASLSPDWVVYAGHQPWGHLHAKSPEIMVTADLDGDGAGELVADFGPGKGLWAAGLSPEWAVTADEDNNPNYPWGHLHPDSAEKIVVGNLDGENGDEIIADFGPSIGIWAFGLSNDWYEDAQTGNRWMQLNADTAEEMITADLDGDGIDELICDFGAASGIWAHSLSDTWAQAWMRLNDFSPTKMAIADLDGVGGKELVVDFGPAKGIWAAGLSPQWAGIVDPDGNNPNYPWGHLHADSVDSLTIADLDGNGSDEIIADFGPAKGIWAAGLAGWPQHPDNGPWAHLYDESGVNIISANIHGDSTEEIIVYFGPSKGIWLRNSDGTWSHLYG